MQLDIFLPILKHHILLIASVAYSRQFDVRLSQRNWLIVKFEVANEINNISKYADLFFNTVQNVQFLYPKT